MDFRRWSADFVKTIAITFVKSFSKWEAFCIRNCATGEMTFFMHRRRKKDGYCKDEVNCRLRAEHFLFTHHLPGGIMEA